MLLMYTQRNARGSVTDYRAFNVVPTTDSGVRIGRFTGEPNADFQGDHANQAAAEAYLDGLHPADQRWTKAKRNS
jgi:hypothetical protein